MKLKEIDYLRFRNQYIFSPKLIDCPFLNNSLKIGSRYLYTHLELLVTEYKRKNLHLILLGDIFDYFPEKSNKDILADLAEDNHGSFLSKLSRYSGCFVLFYIKNNKIFMVTDATSTKKIYHCKIRGNVWSASQPHLLAKVTGIEKTRNPQKLEYYHSREFLKLDNSSIGNTTIYDKIFQLTRNSYLDVEEYKIIRFYPRNKLKKISLEECACKSARMIKGYIESISRRYDLMLPVTAGKDSRVLLAGTFSLKEKVYYYINKEKGMTEESNDIKIPKSLFQKLNLDFHVLDLNIPVDEEFKKIYYENNPLASEFFLPHIYNYYLNFSDKVNLPGNIATYGVWNYPVFRKKITSEELVYLNGVSRFSYAAEEYSKWISNALPFCQESNFSLLNLFYWEERLGNWGAQTGLDKEIAQLEFNVYNSRELVETILSIKQLYKIEYSSYSLNSLIARRLWPEVLQVPINPCRKNTILKLFETFGLLSIVHKIKCR